MPIDKIFEALASGPRRQILAYLSEAELTTSQLAERFGMTAPSISRHLSVLENAGLVSSIRQGQFVLYRLNRDHLANNLTGFVFELCPVARVVYSPANSLWLIGMALAAIVGGVLTFTWAAVAVYAGVTAAVLLLGHSLGSHRKMIHNSYQCPKWLVLSTIAFTDFWSAPGGSSSWFRQRRSTCWEGGGLCSGAFALA